MRSARATTGAWCASSSTASAPNAAGAWRVAQVAAGHRAGPLFLNLMGVGMADGAKQQKLVLAEHPRAVRSIARAKAWGGLGGFLIGGYLALPTHTLADAGLQALAAGVICYVAAWG